MNDSIYKQFFYIKKYYLNKYYDINILFIFFILKKKVLKVIFVIS